MCLFSYRQGPELTLWLHLLVEAIHSLAQVQEESKQIPPLVVSTACVYKQEELGGSPLWRSSTITISLVKM